MIQTRIIKRTTPFRTTYVIQQKHFLFRWWWVDAWINSSCGASCTDSWSNLKEAEANLWLFDGTKATETLV